MSVENIAFKKSDEDFEVMETYYLIIESGSIPDLDWKCLEKRPPTPDSATKCSKDQENTVNSFKMQEPQKTNDFDFSDDIAQQHIRVRHSNSTPKSAKKKTANFAGVMEVLKKKNAEGAT